MAGFPCSSEPGLQGSVIVLHTGPGGWIVWLCLTAVSFNYLSIYG